MARHKRTCKVLKLSILESENARLLAENARLLAENARLLAVNDELVNENLELNARLDESRKARPVHNNVTINIVPYGQEEPLSSAQVQSILSRLPSESVPRYIEMKHFSKPENANIRITNKRGRILQVVQEDGNKRRRWVDRDRIDMLSAITEQSFEELIDQFDAEKYKNWNQWYESSGLDKEGYDKTDAFREIMKKVDNIITSQNASNLISR